MISDEQAEQAKSQLLKQLENFPEDKKEDAEKEIMSMNKEELEEFLKRNKLIGEEKGEEQDETSQQQCIFCSIISDKISSYKIQENEESIAILEINPISKGHILIIPKQHISKSEINENLISFAKEIAERIKQNLQPQDIKIYYSEFFGHGAVNILPIYNDETPDSQRKKASEEELQELQEILAPPINSTESSEETKEDGTEKDEKDTKDEEELSDEDTWLPDRIP